MRRESLKLQESDWDNLVRLAGRTGSLYAGRPSWRRMVLRIARGTITVRVSRTNPRRAAGTINPKLGPAGNTMTNKQQKQFSRRFSLEDWQFLCSKVDFLDALEKSESEAEVVAHQLLCRYGDQ